MTTEKQKRPLVAFATLGCKVNRSDTLAMIHGLPEHLEVVPFSDVADLYVINTCTVTSTADRESRQIIYRAHRKNPTAPILVTGCLADQRPEAVWHQGVVQVVPNAEKSSLPGHIAALLDPTRRATEEAHTEGAIGTVSFAPPHPVYRPREMTRPPLKIQDGCGGHCTYCAVAAARGLPSSLSPDRVCEVLSGYGAQGCSEVVLAGIDLGSYGRDLAPPTTLAALVERIARARPLPRVRLSSIEIHRLDDTLIGALSAAGDILCPHLHLPLQSGSDSLLRAMGRVYDTRTYQERFQAVVSALVGICLGVDVIAGFPGETEADHQATLALLKALGPSYLHVFPFSPRPGTPAATLPEPVPPTVARARAAELRRFSEACWRSFRHSRQGTITRGVVYFVRQEGNLTAFSDEGIPVRLKGPDTWMGQLVPIRLTGLVGSGMEGRCLLE